MSQKSRHLFVRNLFAGSLICCLAVVCGCAYYSYSAHQSYQRLRLSLGNELKHTYSELDDSAFLRNSAEQLTHYRSTGILGKQEKLHWIQLLTTLAEQVPVEEFHFEMSPATLQRAGSVEVHRVDISLRGLLAHDGLLERFFILLSEQGVGAYSIRQLEVESLSSVGSLQAGELPGLEMTAQISWYSLMPADTSTGVAL
jgi:hypothetical protein